MSAADTFKRLQAEGFTIQPDGQRLIVGPASKLTDDIRDELRYFKLELLALLNPAADTTETRVRCIDCTNLTAGRCRNFKAALLMTPEIGPALAALRQHCPGYAHKPPAPSEAPAQPVGPASAAAGLPAPATDPHRQAQAGTDPSDQSDRFDGSPLRHSLQDRAVSISPGPYHGPSTNSTMAPVWPGIVE